MWLAAGALKFNSAGQPAGTIATDLAFEPADLASVVTRPITIEATRHFAPS